MGPTSALLSSSPKNKKNLLWKIKISKKTKKLYHGIWNFLTPRLKRFLYFLKKYFSYISGTGTSIIVPQVLWIWERYFYPQLFSALHFFPTFLTTCLIKASLGMGSSSFKDSGPATEIWATDPTHLFVWNTQCSRRGISQ